MQIVVSDFDGTLKNQLISHKDIDAIKTFQNNGNIFVIATSRYFESINTELTNNCISANYIICVDGGMVFHNNKTIFSYFIDSVILIELADSLSQKNLFYYSVNFGTHQLKELYTSKKTYLRTILFAEVISIVFSFYNQTQADAFVATVFNKFANTIQIFQWESNIKLLSKNVSKEVAVQKLVTTKQLDGNICTVGDGENDIGMLSAFNGYSIKGSLAEKYGFKSTSNVAELLSKFI